MIKKQKGYYYYRACNVCQGYIESVKEYQKSVDFDSDYCREKYGHRNRDRHGLHK